MTSSCRQRPIAARVMTTAILCIALSVEALTTTTTTSVAKTKANMYFDPRPQNRTVVEGQPMEFKCDVSPRKDITIYWNQGNKVLVDTPRRHVTNGYLAFVAVYRGLDSKPFTCVATDLLNDKDMVATAVYLDILWIKRQVKIDITMSNNKVHLNCAADGNPKPRVDWFRNFKPLPQNDRYERADNSLIIEAGGITDNGVYTCVSSNRADKVTSVPKILNLQSIGNRKTFDDRTFKTSVTAVPGQQVWLPCTTRIIPVEWTFKNVAIKSSQYKRVFQNGTLMFMMRRNSEGIYTCTGGGQVYSTNVILAKLSKFDANSISPKTRSLIVAENDMVEVRCRNPGGQPYPTTSWRKERGAAIADRSERLVDRGVLYFKSVALQDTGNYSCRAENVAGSDERSIQIFVTVVPKITEQPVTVRIKEGESASFKCAISTRNSLSTITWQKNGEDIVAGSTPRYRVDTSTGQLTISSVTPSDDASYNCVIATLQQKRVVTSHNARLTVNPKLKFKPKLHNETLELNTDQTIDCKVESNDNYVLEWKRNGKVLATSNELRFNKITRADAGVYVCHIEDEHFKLQQTIYIDVGVKPTFAIAPKNMTAYQGHPLMIHCKVAGDPAPKVTWYKEFSRIEDTRYKTLSNGSLYVAKISVEDSGSYRCSAVNSVGAIDARLRVTVSDAVPTVPEAKGRDLFTTAVVAAACALAYLAVVIAVTAYCSVRVLRKRRRKRGERDGTDGDDSRTQPERSELMKKEACCYESSMTKSDTYSQNSVPIVNYPRADLQTLRVLGKGGYGDVFLARSIKTTASLVSSQGSEQASSGAGGEATNVVLVKSLLSNEISAVKQYRKEVSLLARCRHQNIVTIYGVCEEIHPYFLVTEYCEWGDLKQFLLAMRPENHSTTPLTQGQRLTLCAQIASAVDHLAAVTGQGHGDIAARNVLLTSRLDVKLSVVGLSIDVYGGEYVWMGGARVPLRWAAPESIVSASHSSTVSADVWAYGVFVWEVFTDAELPYVNYTDEELQRLLTPVRSGHASTASYDGSSISGGGVGGVGTAMPQLSWATAAITARDVALLVARCCLARPDERPSFQEIWTILGEMIADSAL